MAGKTKYYSHDFWFYFGRSGRNDKLPSLAAFGSLNKSKGDEITANYMALINALSRRLNKASRRRNERTRHKLPLESRL